MIKKEWRNSTKKPETRFICLRIPFSRSRGDCFCHPLNRAKALWLIVRDAAKGSFKKMTDCGIWFTRHSIHTEISKPGQAGTNYATKSRRKSIDFFAKLRDLRLKRKDDVKSLTLAPGEQNYDVERMHKKS